MALDRRDYILGRIQVDKKTGCWVWQKSLSSSGYPNGSTFGKQVHREAYELWKGPIPTGAQLDHLCRVKACVNPDHLQPVTRGTNVSRGNTARTGQKDRKMLRIARELHKRVGAAAR